MVTDADAGLVPPGVPPADIPPPGVPPPGRAEAVDPGDREYQPMSLRGPALVVLGIAVFIVVVGVVASALDSGSDPTLSIQRIAVEGGTVVPLEPATRAMASIVGAGEPPADILGNMAVPADSSFVRMLNSDNDQTQFDRTVYFSTPLSSAQVIDLYRRLLPRLGWSLIYTGGRAQPGALGTEVLAKKGSGDGFYWEVGAVVSPATAAGRTPYSVELYEQSDDN